MKLTNKKILLIQFLFAACLSMNAVAQNQGMPIPQGPMTVQGMPPHVSEQQKTQMLAKRAEKRAKRLQELKVFLQLQANQEAAWSSFYAAMQKPLVKPERLKPEEIEKLTTPERIDKMMALKAEHDSQMSSRMAAVKTFYAGLNAQQQKVFDMQWHAANKRMVMNQEHRGHHEKINH